MDNTDAHKEEDRSDLTISSSREESIRKALMLAGGTSGTERKVVRPDISTGKMLVSMILRLLPAAAVTVAAGYFPQTAGHRALIGICSLVLTAVLCFKRAVIGAVLLYQKYAPLKLRQACLFVPSCSEYMLLAVQKYGAVKGVWKGIRRLMRCRYPSNGGIDYP